MEAQMKRCQKCGQDAGGGDKFCWKCGERLAEQISAAPIPPPSLDAAGQERSPGRVAVLGLLTLGGYWVFWFYKVSHELKDLRGSDRHPGLRALLFFLACTPVGYWLAMNAAVSPIMRALSSSGFPMPFFFYCAMVGIGTYLLSSAAKDIQELHRTLGSISGFGHPRGYAFFSQFGPFVIPFFAARLQSDLNRYQTIRALAPGVSSEREELRYPQRLPRLVIILSLSTVVLFAVALLAAISIPSYSNYKGRAYNAAASADIRNAKICAEAYYADHNVYPVDLGKAEGCSQPSQDVDIVYEKTAPDKYRITASHRKGDKEYRSSSDETSIFWRYRKDPDAGWRQE